MPSKSNYVHLPCEKEMRLHRSGVIVEEHRENGLPYKIWSADLWECPKCGDQCLFGFGDHPLAHHHQTEEYEALLKSVEFHIR